MMFHFGFALLFRDMRCLVVPSKVTQIKIGKQNLFCETSLLLFSDFESNKLKILWKIPCQLLISAYFWK